MTFPTHPEQRLIDGPTGQLELSVRAPDAPTHLALICHPHSLYGGTMENKVVTTLERAFFDAGAATLRFNFRGVGASGGSYDNGLGEGDDLIAVYAVASAAYPDLPLWLAGFSFGAYVSATRAHNLAPTQLISVAPPIGKWDYAGIVLPRCPWLVLQGDADEVIDAQAVFDYADQHHDLITLLRFDGASHFFHGRLVELKERLAEHLA